MYLIMLNNDDIFAGGYYQDGTDNYLNDILEYNKEDHTWQKVGEMKEARGWHAVAVLADVKHLCP